MNDNNASGGNFQLKKGVCQIIGDNVLILFFTKLEKFFDHFEVIELYPSPLRTNTPQKHKYQRYFGQLKKNLSISENKEIFKTLSVPKSV